MEYLFNQSMGGTVFPKTLREFSFGEAFSYSMRGVALPDELTTISYRRYQLISLLVLFD